MSQDDLPKQTAASADAPSRPKPSPSRDPAPPRGGGTAALALLLALLAAGASGYLGWNQWQHEAQNDADSHSIGNLQQRVGALESALGGVSDERNQLRQRLDDAGQVNRTLREEVLGQGARLRDLEDAVARLSEKSLSGHDAMQLDETESLLRMAQERYVLFHDVQGAAAAYAEAAQALAAVNDAAFAGLRQSLDAERQALEKSVQTDPDSALTELGQLREAVSAWPLKPLDVPGTQAPDGAWARAWHALRDVIKIQRDNGAPLSVADARFARELTALDLAQAQAALLAYDWAGYTAALKRVDASLASQFDTSAPAVQQARAQIAALAARAQSNAPVRLGAALAELRNLRAVHAIKPTDATAPAHAASSSAPAGGAKS